MGAGSTVHCARCEFDFLPQHTDGRCPLCEEPVPPGVYVPDSAAGGLISRWMTTPGRARVVGVAVFAALSVAMLAIAIAAYYRQ